MALLHVLVIDDDEEDAAITRRALADIPWFTCAIDSANTYASALAALRTTDYDVILLDYGLGERSGLERLQEAFGATLPLAVVLLTGMPSRQLDESVSRAGISHLLEKSELGGGQLERSIRYALERTHIERELRRAQAFFRSAFDALSDHVAILDEHGQILDVNRAWKLFADANVLPDAMAGRGENYLDVCDAAAARGDQSAAVVAAGLRAVLHGGPEHFEMVYPCHASFEERWFIVSASRVIMDGETRLMVAHENITQRLRAERASADALLATDRERRRLQATLDIMPVGVIITNAAGGVTHANAEARKIWATEGVASAPAGSAYRYAASFADTSLPLEAGDWAGAITRATGEPVLDQLLEIARLDGTRGHVLNSAAPIRDADGTITGAVIVNVDVTERYEKEAERARLAKVLEFERNRLTDIFAKAPAFMAVMRGPQHMFEMVNEAYVALVGRNPTGRSAAEGIPEAVEQGFVALADRVFATGEAYVGVQKPFVARPHDGCERKCVVNFVFQPLWEADGSVSGVLIHGVDVTAQAVAAEALRQSEAQYRSLVELSPDGILIHVDGIIVFANQAAVKILGGDSASDLRGRPMVELVHEDFRAESRRRMERLGQGEPVRPTDMRWLTLAGEPREMNVSSMGFTFGARAAVHTVFRDMTSHRLLEEQLRQAQKMEAVGQLAGGVAHDFNNLLTVIKANVEFLLEDLDAESPHRSDVMEVNEAAERAATLTRQLLAFSRKQILQTRVLDCSAVVRNVQPMLSRLIREDIVVGVTLAEQLGLVVADPGQLAQVLLNLAVNARDAMPMGGQLTICTDEVTLAANTPVEDLSVVVPGRYAMILVADTGTGIPPAVRSRIFEPFFTTKPVGEGTGLGLATVYGIVKQTGGYLQVESEVGVGTTFRIYLPVVVNPLREVHDVAAPLDARGSETILVVEDMDALREVVRRVLAREGYTVLEARNGREALDVAARYPAAIHLLLTDVVMPGMNGLQVAESLLRTRPELAVLFMSGYAEDAATRRSIEETSASFVAKPFSPLQLLQRVREAISA